MKIIQPRVARNELPWEARPEQDINSERVASNRVASNSNDDTGLMDLIGGRTMARIDATLFRVEN